VVDLNGRDAGNHWIDHMRPEGSRLDAGHADTKRFDFGAQTV
jgi:hypothetical protein